MYTGSCVAVYEEMAAQACGCCDRLCVSWNCIISFLPSFLSSHPLSFFLPSFLLFLPPSLLPLSHFFSLPPSPSLLLFFSPPLSFFLSETFRSIFCLVPSPTWGNGWLMEMDKKDIVLHDLDSFASRTQHNESWRMRGKSLFLLAPKERCRAGPHRKLHSD